MLMTETEAAEFLKVSPNALRTLRSTGPKPGGMAIPPYIKMGRAVRYDHEDLQRYVDTHRVKPQGTA